jgi:hypothetical protein
MALEIVQSKINHGIDATTTLNDIEESLKHHFGSEELDVNEMHLVKGRPIAKGNFESFNPLSLIWSASSIWPGERARRSFSSWRTHMLIF